ncbi:hypothetical protein BE61_04060 [Bradyrhizobium elkanii USDA 61]|nr:hypothetical protein BE61_04060 [Bradyrhizobium elkanii USDA 61]GEC56475.1 hypothetical protein BEL01nite_55180 [Bradyrhizobium elkanii]
MLHMEHECQDLQTIMLEDRRDDPGPQLNCFVQKAQRGGAGSASPAFKLAIAWPVKGTTIFPRALFTGTYAKSHHNLLSIGLDPDCRR